MATVRQRSGSFRVEWRLGGRRGGHPEGVTLPTEKLAIQAKNIAEARGHNITTDEMYELFGIAREPAAAASPTYKEWATQWLDAKMDIEESTRREYAILLESRIVPFFGACRLAEIDNDMVQRFIKASAREVKPATVTKLYAVLHGSLDAAIPKWIPFNPCKVPGKKERNLPTVKRFDCVFLTKAEARMITDHASPLARDLIETLLVTGCRIGELTNLECQHVTLPSVPIGPLPPGEGQPFIFIAKAKTDAGVRPVTISRQDAERLRPLVEGRSPTALVFTSPNGDKWDEHNFRSRYWYRAVASASRCLNHMPPLKIVKRGPERLDPMSVSTCGCRTRLRKRPRIHDTRHTHADWCVEGGMDFDKLRRRLGHESIKTTIDLYGNRRRDATEDDLGMVSF